MKVLETINSNTPAQRPKTLKKLKRVYDTNGDTCPKSDNEKSSSSEKEFDKENTERRIMVNMQALITKEVSI